MRFTPKTEQEIQSINLLQDGLYNYEVIFQQEGISNAGNPQIKIKLKVFNHDGKEKIVDGYLNEKFPKILKHYCDVNGKSNYYDSGNLPGQECLGDNGGLVHITIDKGKPIPDDLNGKCFPDRNVIKDFVENSNQQTNFNPKKEEQIFNDDIPF